jgi:OOP family OmpA-OmpF porin
MKPIFSLRFKPTVTMIGAMLGLAASPALSQAPMFRANQLEVNAIVEALTPPLPPGVKSRNIVARPAQNFGAASVVDITFATNSATLTPASRSALDVFAKALASDSLSTFRFSVEGHADPRGTSEYNLRLSQARAESVVSYLVNQHGLDINRLHPVGKGDTELARPDVPTAPENRRVTFKTELN